MMIWYQIHSFHREIFFYPCCKLINCCSYIALFAAPPPTTRVYYCWKSPTQWPKKMTTPSVLFIHDHILLKALQKKSEQLYKVSNKSINDVGLCVNFPSAFMTVCVACGPYLLDDGVQMFLT